MTSGRDTSSRNNAAGRHNPPGRSPAADQDPAADRSNPSDREAHLVELVDETGSAIGAGTVDEAHRPPGLLHRAFSVLLLDRAGRILLQRRAAAKTRFPLRWANTCCGHPAPGQSLGAAASRRLHEELGIDAVPLTEIGVYLYRAEDSGTGRVEFEYDHVLRGKFAADRSVLPDPDEVADVRWVHPEQLRADLVAHPEAYAPWLGGVLSRLVDPEAEPPAAPSPAATAVTATPPPEVTPAGELAEGEPPTAVTQPGAGQASAGQPDMPRGSANRGRWNVPASAGQEDNPAERSGGR